MTLTPRSVSGLEVRGPQQGAHAAILTGDALDFVAGLVRDFAGPPRRAPRAPPRAAAALRRRRAPALPRGDEGRARGSVDRRAPARRPPRPPRRDHRPRRPQDDHQRAQLRRAGLHGGLRGLELADVGQRRPRPPAPDGRRARHDRVHGAGHRKAVPLGPEGRDADGAAAGLAPARAARRRSTRSRSRRRSSTSASTSSTTRRALAARGTGPYFYLPKLQSHLEARLWNDVFVTAQKRLGIPRARSRRPSSSRRCPPRSRWTRSSTSCASTRPASTAGAGTTSSASSRRSAPTRRGSSPTARRSR